MEKEMYLAKVKEMLQTQGVPLSDIQPGAWFMGLELEDGKVTDRYLLTDMKSNGNKVLVARLRTGRIFTVTLDTKVISTPCPI
jgi:hypothetical protein